MKSTSAERQGSNIGSWVAGDEPWVYPGYLPDHSPGGQQMRRGSERAGAAGAIPWGFGLTPADPEGQ